LIRYSLREEFMKVLADVSITPIGSAEAAAYIAECAEVFRESGLRPRVHSHGTNIEGDWDTVFTAIKNCHSRLHHEGVVRVTTDLRLDTRSDRDETGTERLEKIIKNIS
jgi:uncharacterized protein (TIGR00106 family)